MKKWFLATELPRLEKFVLMAICFFGFWQPSVRDKWPCSFQTLLSLTGDHCDPLLDSPSSSALWDREAENSPEPSDLIHLSRTISADYLNLISCHLKVLFYLNRQDLQAAFNYQEEMSKWVSTGPWFALRALINGWGRQLSSSVFFVFSVLRSLLGARSKKLNYLICWDWG